MMKKLLIVFIFTVLCSPAFAAEKIVIAVQPTSTAAELSDRATALEKRLEEATGADVEMVFPTSYAGVVESLNFGHAQAAFMGAWPASLAVSRAGSRVALAEVRDVMIDGEKKEEPYYFSYWVVLKDSPLRSLEDLKGKRVAFSNPLSTSGYVAPLAELVIRGLVPVNEKGPDASGFFSEMQFAGGYAQAVEALRAGRVDATVIAGDVPEALYTDVMNTTRIIGKQGPIPSHVVVFSKDFTGARADGLRDALVSLSDEEGKALMKKFVSGIFVRFTPAGNEHLADLDAMLEKTRLEYKEKPKS
jgi:phosphonate transport system substrate-binding protein